MFFGLTAVGVERNPEMAQTAQVNTCEAYCADALTYDNYQNYDIIWMYRPFKDALHEYQLEQLVYDTAKPGAIVAGGALESQPEGWIPVMDDWDSMRRGAWKKP